MELMKSIRNVDTCPRRRKANTLESIDRISALPDSILGVILSLIPTRNSVATSTLSKRWQFLWTMVHNLVFYLDNVGHSAEQVVDENNKFVGFVNHVLLHHDAGLLTKFALVWRSNCIESPQIISWIETAVTRNVHELSLDLCNRPLDIPISVFSCDKLRTLKLRGWWICLSAPTVFCLPKLETLDLDGVTFQSGKAFAKIIKGCPVLNHLRIYLDENDDYFRFIISSTSLTSLHLHLGLYKHVMLKVPSLEHLMLYNYNSTNFVQKNLTSLVEAYLDVFLEADDDFSQVGFLDSIVDTVSALGCAKRLNVSDHVMRALSYATKNLSTDDFKRLVELETRTFCCHWSSLQTLLQCSNNLQVLTIEKVLLCFDDENDHDHSNWSTPIQVPRCLSTSLKKIEINGSNGFEDEREMICYMLKHGGALEVMHISFDRDIQGSMFELIEEICEYPKMSAICEIKFSQLLAQRF